MITPEGLRGTKKVPVRALTATYQLDVVKTTNDHEWDNFLLDIPNGYHVQSTLWSRVKELLGWRPLRIMVRESETGVLLGGAQILIRRTGLMNIGYLTKGPVFKSNDPALYSWFIEELKHVARRNSIGVLMVQPPGEDPGPSETLAQHGFAKSPVQISLTATVQIDLKQDLETILANMKQKTRYNIRLAERRNVIVREGSPQDLSIFYSLLTMTSDRQEFKAYSLEYFERMQSILGEAGCFKVFIAEYDREPVSALLAIAFGNRVHYKKGAWSGRYGKHRPNELMHWTAIQWAKEQGYHYYDFDGIDRQVAEALLEDDSLPADKTETVSRFKIGFGGEVVLVPSTFVWSYVPFLQKMYCNFYPKVSNWRLVRYLYGAFRWS